MRVPKILQSEFAQLKTIDQKACRYIFIYDNGEASDSAQSDQVEQEKLDTRMKPKEL